MRRRKLLQTVASASIASTMVGTAVGKNQQTGLTIKKEKRPEDRPLSKKDLSSIQKKALKAHASKHGRNEASSRNDGAVIVPEHTVPESSNIVSYLFSVTPDGRTQFYLGAVEGNPTKTVEVSSSDGSPTTETVSLDPSDVGISAADKHAQMDQFEADLKNEFDTSTSDVTTQATSCESWRNFKFDEWGCPVAGGQVSLGEYPHGYADEYTKLHQLEGDWFAVGTDLLSIPGTNEWGTPWYNHYIDVRQGWQENAFDNGKTEGWWPYETSSTDLTSLSAGFSAGPDSVGASIGASWNTPNVGITNSHNSTQGSWHVDVNDNRGSSFQSTYSSVFKFDSSPNPDDQLVVTEIDHDWGKDCLEGHCLSVKEYSTSTDYRYEQF